MLVPSASCRLFLVTWVAEYGWPTTGAASSVWRTPPFERISLFAGVVVWAKVVDIKSAAVMIPVGRRLRIRGESS